VISDSRARRGTSSFLPWGQTGYDSESRIFVLARFQLFVGITLTLERRSRPSHANVRSSGSVIPALPGRAMQQPSKNACLIVARPLIYRNTVGVRLTPREPEMTRKPVQPAEPQTQPTLALQRRSLNYQRAVRSHQRNGCQRSRLLLSASLSEYNTTNTTEAEPITWHRAGPVSRG
jgi:hypothetical protein